jgi:hypothetical protein
MAGWVHIAAGLHLVAARTAATAPCGWPRLPDGGGVPHWRAASCGMQPWGTMRSCLLLMGLTHSVTICDRGPPDEVIATRVSGVSLVLDQGV